MKFTTWSVLAYITLSATASQAAPAKTDSQAHRNVVKKQADQANLLKEQTVELKKQVITLEKSLHDLRREAKNLRARSVIQATPTAAPSTAPTRRILSRTTVEGQKLVDRVEAMEIAFPPHFQAGLHLHACPVVGRVNAGTILFQIDGQPPQTLHAGDTFLEPANARILHFDSIGDSPATFTAFYLAGKGDQELVTMLPKTQN